MDQIILTPKELGAIVRKARKKQGLTQDDLTGLTLVGRRFISDLENGKETAQLGKALTVLKALGVSIHAITKWKISEDT